MHETSSVEIAQELLKKYSKELKTEEVILKM